MDIVVDVVTDDNDDKGTCGDNDGGGGDVVFAFDNCIIGDKRFNVVVDVVVVVAVVVGVGDEIIVYNFALAYPSHLTRKKKKSSKKRTDKQKKSFPKEYFSENF